MDSKFLEVQMDIKKRSVLRKPEITERSALSSVTIWRLEKAGQFPKRIRLGGNSVGWFADEFDEWLEQKSRERFTGPEAEA
jgi:prophage regulatory protein